MRWGAVIAGTILAIGLWLLLQTIGMGLGLSAVDTDDSGSLRGVGIGTGIWSIIAPLIALFLGAMLAGRLAGTYSPRVGAMHGSVLWALTSVAGLWALISILSMLASGVKSVGSAAVGATSSAISSAVGVGDDANIMESLGIDANDLLGPINEKLREQGKPAITAEQLRSAIRSAAQRGLREGRFDRELFADELARGTALTRADVQDLASQLSDRYESASAQVRDKLSDVGERAESAALTAADRTGKGMLMAGLALLLGLGAALGGGALGARLAARELRADERDRTRDTTIPPGSVTRDDRDVIINTR